MTPMPDPPTEHENLLRSLFDRLRWELQFLPEAPAKRNAVDRASESFFWATQALRNARFEEDQ